VAAVRLAWEGPALRIEGVAPDAAVRVVPEELVGLDAVLPASPGTWRTDGTARTFEPRFPFVGGRRYAVFVDGDAVGALERPRAAVEASAVRVAQVFPSGDSVPRNLLRLYIWFTGPMSDGYAGNIRVDGADDTFLTTAEELWDPTRTRLTLFLDPARIKRGLVPHQVLGYPLREGTPLRLVIEGMRDAGGAPVEAVTVERTVGPDLRHRLDPAAWDLSPPVAGTRQPLTLAFDRPLDHGLLRRTLTAPVPGTATIGLAERSWSFVPDEPWPPGPHELVIDTILEDVAGNSMRRAFDRALENRRDDPIDAETVRLRFTTVTA
jgi:hypothetical protein